MKILVTGSYGQLGSEIKKLSSGQAGFECLFTDYDTLDITDAEAVKGCFDVERPAFVVNCAAYTAVDQAEKEEQKAFLLNARGAGNLARACREIGARLIHISTDYVFDGRTWIPYTEEAGTNPQGIYGQSKLKGEEEVVALNSESLIIRTSWLYSSFGNNFVKTMIRLGRERDHLNVVFDQVGTPTYARDLAKAILEIIGKADDPEWGWKPGIYHYSNEGVCSWYDFAREIHLSAGISCRIGPILSAEYPTPARRPHFSVLDKKKIKSAYGLTIPYWKQSLEECMKLLINK